VKVVAKVVSVLTGRQAVILEVQAMENTPDLSSLMCLRIDHKMSPYLAIRLKYLLWYHVLWYIKKIKIFK